MRRFGIRARGRSSTQPRRAGVLALAGAVTALSVAGAAVVVQRSGDGTEGRLRHGHLAGAVETGTAATDPLTDSSPAVAPDASADPAGPAGAAVPGDTASVITTAGTAPGLAGAAQPVAPGGAPAKGTAVRPAPTATTRPAAPAPTSPARPTTASPGWHPLPKAPVKGRDGHTAVWTGREMVIWGGTGDFETDPDPYTDGAAFDPATRIWRSVAGAPLAPRLDARAFWTGTEMIVFGGTSAVGDALADGAAWNPASNTWRPLPRSPLGPREGAVVAWAGDRLVVWGGSTVLAPDAPAEAETDMPNEGAAYLPATDRWVSLAAAPIPGRSGAESAWTGTRLVISGGSREGEDDERADGAALDPASGAWTPIAARPEPGSCGGGSGCDGVWTGRGAVFPVSGLLYDPAGDRWSVIAAAPEVGGPALGEPAAWTGRRLLVWGTATESDGSDEVVPVGEETGEGPATAGAAYDPATDAWSRFPGGPLSGRERHTVVWSGEELLVWGGGDGDAGLADGAAYRPG